VGRRRHHRRDGGRLALHLHVDGRWDVRGAGAAVISGQRQPDCDDEGDYRDSDDKGDPWYTVKQVQFR
jgi:hypothetical protein